MIEFALIVLMFTTTPVNQPGIATLLVVNEIVGLAFDQCHPNNMSWKSGFEYGAKLK